MDFEIRPYAPQFLPDLCRICLLTGDSGNDATGLYEHPELLGDVFAVPYATFEPDLTFILTDAKGACGYILGTCNTRAFGRWMNEEWLPLLREKYPLEAVPDPFQDGWLIRFVHQDWEPSKWAEEYPAHLHIDLLPRVQGQGMGRKLMEAFLGRLRELGVPGVHLGTSWRNRQAMAFYEHLGFARLEDREGALVFGMKL